MNFRKLYLKFYDGTDLCELQGKSDPTIEVTSPSKMAKLLNKGPSISSIHLCNISISATAHNPPLLQVDEVQTDQLQLLLQEYADIFE